MGLSPVLSLGTARVSPRWYRPTSVLPLLGVGEGCQGGDRHRDVGGSRRHKSEPSPASAQVQCRVLGPRQPVCTPGAHKSRGVLSQVRRPRGGWGRGPSGGSGEGPSCPSSFRWFQASLDLRSHHSELGPRLPVACFPMSLCVHSSCKGTVPVFRASLIQCDLILTTYSSQTLIPNKFML